MYLCLDSNIFYNNWFADSADFRLLFNYLSNTESKLLISEIVIEEINRTYKSKVQDTISKANSALGELNRLTRNHQIYDLENLRINYDLRTILEEHSDSIVIYPYDNISQKVTIARTLSETKPFQANDKGYRDTLIWLSLLEYIKRANPAGDIYFINKNTNDFFEKGSITLHKDLEKDIENRSLSGKFVVYEGLPQFFQSELDKNEHLVAYPELYNFLEGETEYEVVRTLDQMSESDFLNLIRTSNFPWPYINTLLFHKIDCWEGSEDAEIHTVKDLGNNQLYIDYSFNLRRCNVDLTISKGEYLANKIDIDKWYDEATLNGDAAELSHFARIYFKTSFDYDPVTKAIGGITIHSIRFRRD